MRDGGSRTEDWLALLLLLPALPLLRLGLQDLEKSPNAAVLPAHAPEVRERRQEEAVVDQLDGLKDERQRKRSRAPPSGRASTPEASIQDTHPGIGSPGERGKRSPISQTSTYRPR